MVIKTCSFTVNGPGLSETPKILTLGTTLAHRRTMGKEINCATTYQWNYQHGFARAHLCYVHR